ncbi:CGNR zinc finger domain-containing protein [Methylosinus sp. LW4]|uniref:CGNR zinc finger domain-containing protein n=1 Tax=Methylosinus sp. LW4 TaxID=136993 RepID=UPI000367F11C|nr:CGNR zinc finger domain-containing protein [Methylosinus sp. LW4]
MMIEASEWRDGMPFFGGALWIDFLNTTPIVNGETIDFLADAEGLAKWARAAGIDCSHKPSKVELKSAWETREALRKLFDKISTGEAISTRLLEPVDSLLGSVEIRERLFLRDGRVALTEETRIEKDVVAAVVARDFAKFVCETEPGRMKRCANPDCSMVFYDRGRNNIRRWCTMAICGNRDKVAHYRARKAREK